MEKILKYIIESNIKSLQDTINSKIKEIVNDGEISDEEVEKILNKINVLLSKIGISTDILYSEKDGKKSGVFVQKGLSTPQIKNTLIQKFDHYDALDKLVNIYNEKKTFSSKELLKNTDIYELINKHTDNVFGKDLLEDLFTYTPNPKNIAMGPGEVLSLLFLSDIKDDNNGPADISTIDSGELEYKGCGGIPKGQGNSSFRKPIEMYKVFESYLIILGSKSNQSSSTPNLFGANADELDKELEKAEKELDKTEIKNIPSAIKAKCFGSSENFKSYFDDILSNHFNKISDTDINSCIAKSILALANDQHLEEFNKKYGDKFIKYVNETRPIIVNNKIHKDSFTNFKMAWVVFAITHYQMIEKWDNLVCFGKPSVKGNYNGKYIVITHDDMKSFASLDKKLEENKIISLTNPKLDDDNARHYSPNLKIVIK